MVSGTVDNRFASPCMVQTSKPQPTVLLDIPPIWKDTSRIADEIEEPILHDLCLEVCLPVEMASAAYQSA